PLGDYFADPAFGNFDAVTAIGYYQRAADGGNVNGLLRIGTLYRDGRPELPVNGPAAAGYFAKAIEADNNAARRYLGEMLLSGTIVEPDVPAGLALYQEAIARGDSAAALQLAWAYRDGLGVVADGARAQALLQPLAEAGNTS